MVDIKITCPACSKTGKVEVEENIIKSSLRGITAVNIGEFLVCPHSFIVYIDMNFAVRDCFCSDFKVELPEIKFHNKFSSPKKIDFDIDLIRINLLPSQLIFLLRCVFLKKKIVILFEQDFVIEFINSFLEYIMEDQFIYDVSFISSKSYSNNKKLYKNHLIIQGNKIIKGKEKLFDSKKLKIESTIVQKFYEEFDSKSGLIIFKNEIQKTYLLSLKLMDFIKQKQKAKIEITQIIDELYRIHNVKVNSIYIDFLIDIVKNYHDIDVPIIKQNVLGFL